ncbi:MAG: asparaginase, partial [Thermoanaerobaculia bacterium]
FSPRGYWQPAHPIQREALARVAAWTGVPPGRIGIGVDGCSLPVFYLPLSALALAYARLLSRAAGAVADRLLQAMWQRPDMMAGAGRFTSAFLAAGRGRWVGKEGAEGVYAIGIRAPRAGQEACGLAFKIEDGSTRARDAVALALLERLGLLPGPAASKLAAYRDPPVRNARGLPAGRIEADAGPVKMHGSSAQRP